MLQVQDLACFYCYIVNTKNNYDNKDSMYLEKIPLESDMLKKQKCATSVLFRNGKIDTVLSTRND